jgi:putative DNA primase/helicase
MQGSDTAARERATAELLGKRFVTSSETEEGHRFNEAKIKHLTGMGRLTARRIYGSPFEYDPMFKLFIDANHKPVIRGSDIAIWNRIRLIPFGVSIPKAEQDKELGAKLRAEAPGLLAWAVEGCLKWRAKGLREPETVSNAGEQYREEMDIVADFLADCCVVDAEAEVAVGDLYKAYRSWCEGLHEEAISDSAFGKRLTVKNFPLQRTSLVRLRKGLRLRSPEDSIHAEQAESQLAA